MENKNPIQELQSVRQWAKDKLASGEEPPWAWFQYMKLLEAIDQTLEGLASTVAHTERRLRIVSEDPETPKADVTVRMPL